MIIKCYLFLIFVRFKENHTIERIIMKILLTLVMVCSVLVLGYAAYMDSNKKRQEIIKIVAPTMYLNQ